MVPTPLTPDPAGFNSAATLPYQLRLEDFELAMRDIYDLLGDINSSLRSRGLRRMEEFVRPAGFSGILSDALTASLAKHSRTLTVNLYHNGHPDLVPEGLFALNRAQSGEDGIEVKVTRGSGGVDMHGARPAWLCLFRYAVDSVTEPAVDRAATVFIEVLLAKLEISDFRTNERGQLGTRTASPNSVGLQKLRTNWIYREPSISRP
jgi:hypothetical protein